LLLPPLRIGAWIPVEPASAFRLAAAPVLSRSEYVRLVDKAMEYTALAQTHRPLPYSLTSLGLLTAWLSGILILLIRLFVGINRLKRLASTAYRDAHLWKQTKDLAAELSIRGNVSVLLSPRCSIPFTFGLLRPVILLPVSSTTWPSSRQRSALIHELAHVGRRDVLIQSLAYAVCLLFWFIPLLWMAYTAMLREAETCCDQQVINRGIRGPEYARDIVDLARKCEGRILLPCISNTIGRKSMLKDRIKKVLHLKPGNFPFGVRGAARVVLAICLCCLVPILAITAQTKQPVVENTDMLFGTWINPDGATQEMGAKVVFFPEYRELWYIRPSDSTPSMETRSVIEETWIDADGNFWYKGRHEGDYYPSKKAAWNCYWLIKINASGTTLEFVEAGADYPEEMSPIGGSYNIYYK
jgi:beta-lactamase regulating signal transducer with metallopeptidase domain